MRGRGEEGRISEGEGGRKGGRELEGGRERCSHSIKIRINCLQITFVHTIFFVKWALCCW